MTSSPPALDLKPQRPTVLSLRPQSGASVRPGTATPTGSGSGSASASGGATPTGTSSSSSSSSSSISTISSSTPSSTPSTSTSTSTSSTTDSKKSYAGVSSSITSTRGGYASRVAGTRGGAGSRPTGDRRDTRDTRDSTPRTGSGTPTKPSPSLRIGDRYSQPRDNKRIPSITIPSTPIEKSSHSPPLSSSSPTSHPLEYEWTFWFDSRSTQPQPRRPNEWGANLKEVGSFSDVEGFWRYYHHIQKPSQIEMNANYHLFKKGIRPAWEDPANQHGGKWTVKIGSRERQHLDAYWQNLLLSMLGETLDSGDEITGAVVSRRRAGDRITVWNRHRDQEDAIQEIGRALRTILPEDVTSNPSFELSYDSHGDHPAVRHAEETQN